MLLHGQCTYICSLLINNNVDITIAINRGTCMLSPLLTPEVTVPPGGGLWSCPISTSHVLVGCCCPAAGPAAGLCSPEPVLPAVLSLCLRRFVSWCHGQTEHPRGNLISCGEFKMDGTAQCIVEVMMLARGGLHGAQTGLNRIMRVHSEQNYEASFFLINRARLPLRRKGG